MTQNTHILTEQEQQQLVDLDTAIAWLRKLPLVRDLQQQQSQLRWGQGVDAELLRYATAHARLLSEALINVLAGTLTDPFKEEGE